MMQIMQGDAYDVAITLKDEDNHPITDSDVDEVEVTLGNLEKSAIYSEGEWVISLSQEETFALEGIEGLQVRCLFRSGDVAGAKVGKVYILNSASKEVLR